MKEQILAVQKMQDYIAKNLCEEITMADLARASLFSPWYSYRLFKQYLSITPSDYIRKLRLTTSAKMLKDDKRLVLDAAFYLGFGSVDCFQRAFYREFGCNPGEYALHPVPLKFFIPYGVKFKYLHKEKQKMEDVKNVFVQVIKKPKRKAIIMRGVKATEYFEYCEEVGCDVFGVLSSMDSLCGEPVCMWLPKAMQKSGTSVYVQGVEVPVDFSGEVPSKMDLIDLPEATYLMFQGEPFLEENFEEAILSVQSAMNKYGPSLLGYKWDDDNPRIQLEPRGERGYIEMRAVKE